jgi:hypothetical protein
MSRPVRPVFHSGESAPHDRGLSVDDCELSTLAFSLPIAIGAASGA